MKNTSNLLFIPFMFLFYVNYSQTINITESTEVFSDINEYESINIFTENENILVSGSLISRNRFISPGIHKITILPSENYYIKILPTSARGNDAAETKIKVQDDDKGKINTISTINIHPNPTKNKITINSKQKIKKIEVYNSYGIEQTINQKTGLKNNVILNIENYKKGLYILKIYLNNSAILTKKIVKN